MKILVTGGTGYIGSHTVVELQQAGYEVVALDNFDNSSPAVLDNIKKITGKDLVFGEVDIRDKAALTEFLKAQEGIDAVIHFAANKAVGESVEKPLNYYNNNLVSTLNLLELLDKYGCYQFVFSSSATVYGSAIVPINENTQTGIGITNPYGRTKYMLEEILHDYYKSKILLFSYSCNC